MARKSPAYIYANKSTGRAHRGDVRNDRCRVGQLKKENREEFETLGEAIRAGYRGCRHCFHNPQEGQ